MDEEVKQEVKVVEPKQKIQVDLEVAAWFGLYTGSSKGKK